MKCEKDVWKNTIKNLFSDRLDGSICYLFQFLFKSFNDK